MNERIKELAEQAGFCHDINHGIYLCAPMHMEKFAELIVRECAGIACDHMELNEGTDYNIGSKIKEHFGVEE